MKDLVSAKANGTGPGSAKENRQDIATNRDVLARIAKLFARKPVLWAAVAGGVHGLRISWQAFSACAPPTEARPASGGL